MRNIRIPQVFTLIRFIQYATKVCYMLNKTMVNLNKEK